MTTGIAFTDQDTGETGWMMPVGWFPEIKPKPFTSPDIDAQAAKAEPWEGGKRGHLVVQGIPIAIENPAGSIRSGVDPNGTKWSVRMVNHYGFCERRIGADGDGVDVFIGPNTASDRVFIVNQVDPTSGEFDEHKVMLGWDSAPEAAGGYLDNYSPGWRGLGSIAEHSIDEFKEWLSDENSTRTIAKGGDHPPLQPGDHWIAMHHGDGKATPVLIHMIPGSHGTARVIGGAKGKLNGLRLNKLDPAKWKETSKANAKMRREAEMKRKASLTPDELAKEKEATEGGRAERRKAEKDFIKETLGPEAAQDGQAEDPKAQAELHRTLLREAKKVAADVEKKVMLDAEARGAAGLSVVGSSAPMDLEQILAEAGPKGGPGYDQKLAERAAKAGMTTEKLMAKVDEVRALLGKAPKGAKAGQTPEALAANMEVHKATKELAAQKTAAAVEAVKAALDANKDYARILKARQALRGVYKEQLAKRKGITFEPGYQMAVSTPDEHEALVQSLHEQLLTDHVRGFLEEVGERWPENSEIDPFKSNELEGMHQSRGAGAFDLLHDVGLAALGQGLIDRDVVECLGPEAAAQIVARGIRQNFSHEDQQAVLEALEHHHLKEQEEVLPKVTEDAQALRAKAAEYDQELVEVAHDLPTAVEIQKNKVGALEEARRMLGGALGRLEARAALIAALEGTPRNEQSIPLGRMTPEKAILTAAALGMPEGSYTIEHEDGEAILTAKGEAMDALIHPVDCAALGEREAALSIKGGQQDEENWIPPGFANRLADRYSNPELELPEFQRQHGIQDGDGPEAMKVKLKTWMGARLADGERPEDIVASAYSTQVADPEALHQVLAELVPLHKDGVAANADDLAGYLAPMMDGYFKANPEESGQTLQGQRVQEDPNFHEAMHRALAQDPRLQAAYIPVGELTHSHVQGLKDFWHQQQGDSHRAKFEAALSKLGPEPPKIDPEIATVNLGAGIAPEDGDAGDSPEWTKWSAQRAALEAEYKESADKPTAWDQFVKDHQGTKGALGAIQEQMKGTLNEGFADHYHHVTGRQLQTAKVGERTGLGTALENQIRSLMPAAAAPFAGRKGTVKVDEGIHMSGKYAAQQRAVKAITQLKRMGLFYGAGCVYGGTRLHCEVTGQDRTFFDWWLSGERPVVASMAEDGQVVTQKASPVFVKGYEEMLRIRCSNGSEIFVTPRHLFLGVTGWVHAGDLICGSRIMGAPEGGDTTRDETLDQITRMIHPVCVPASGFALPVSLAPPASIPVQEFSLSPTDPSFVAGRLRDALASIPSELGYADGFEQALLGSILGCVPSVPLEGGQSFCHISPDFQGNCSACLRPDEGQPLGAQGDGQESPPSQGDVPGHTPQSSHRGDLGYGAGHTRSCRECAPPSRTHSTCPDMQKAHDEGSHDASGGKESLSHPHQTAVQSGSNSSLHRDRGDEVPRLKSEPSSMVGLLAWVSVLSVESAGFQVVFDITVPDSHTYIAQGLVNHNSGKTGIMLGALTTLHHDGKLKKAILAVPSVVQGQFGAESIRFVDPSTGFHVHARPGESYEQRLAAYRDPDQHAIVVTHQTLRDDTLQILGDHLGKGPEGARDFLMNTPPKEAAAAVKEAFTKAGIDFNALMVDEAHGALDREGKVDSVLSKVMDAHSHNSDYVTMATGDPLKNDVSEVWSNLNKIDPHRYPPESKDEFLRRFKNNTPLAKKSMAQELSRYWFNGRVDPGKDCYKSNLDVPLTDKQKAAVDQVELASGKLRTGAPDALKWARILAPKSFEGKPEADHAAIAERVRKAVGTMRESAMNRIINLDPEGGKMAEHVRIAKERIAQGKPVVIFSHNLQAVRAIQAAMEKAGIKATSLTGKDSSKDKAAKATAFNSGQADVIVMSDAGATGLNLQHGKCLIHHDLPATAMCHNQRTARIWRVGQKDNVESITLMADSPWEKNNMERVKHKGVLGEIFQDPTDYLDDAGLAGDLKAIRARAAQNKAA
jgi:hypothetical protein